VNVVLLQSTPEPEKLVALAARLCYSPAKISDLQDDISRRDVRKLIRRVLSMGHSSVLEHAVFTYGGEGISRAASHQLVRHRIASYSQQSQRYVAADFGYVVPETIGGNPVSSRFERHMKAGAALYKEMLAAGVPPEDARFALPNATETKILITMNARELHHFFSLRLCRRAQWEIREMAGRMLVLASGKAPLLFETAGPGCVRGRCPEGKMTCGNPGEVRREVAAMKEGTA